MLDYHAHIASLRSLSDEAILRLAGNPNPELQAVSDAVVSKFPYAALGAITDRLLEHADGTADRELAVLNEGAILWSYFTKMISQVADVRQKLENLVLDPSQSDLVPKFNAISNGFSALRPMYNDLMAKLQVYYADLNFLDWIKQHGQQLDQSTAQWTWRDVVLSRRTGMLSSNILRRARSEGSTEATAFAYGALAGYAGNVVGSAYLNQTVGGPRRCHPYRERLAETSVGAWFLEHRPTMTFPIPVLRSVLTFGAPQSPSLPPKIANILGEALKDTYADKFGTPPDLQLAYSKLLRHLDLLTSFVLPPTPPPINATLWSKVLTMKTQDLANTSASGSGSPGSSSPSGGSSSNDHSVWYYVVTTICMIATAVCYLIGWCSNDKGQNAPRYPDPTTSDPSGVGQAQSYLTSDDAYAQVHLAFNLHMALYSLGVSGLTLLTYLGLIYPDGRELGAPAYGQSVATPPTFSNPAPFTTIHRPIADPSFFLGVPSSTAEQPTGKINPFPAATPPSVFLTGLSGTEVPNVNQYGMQLWMAEAQDSNDSEIRKVNRNLDADRGFNHECWEIPSGSIGIDPLPVSILAYTAA